MKNVVFFFTFSVLIPQVFGQISDEDMLILRTKWKMELEEKSATKIEKWGRDESKSLFADSMAKQFFKDTFLLDQLLLKQIKKDPTNLGKSKANMACMADYDVLVNSYFSLLLSKLKDEDKELLEASQQKWKAYMENERKLCGMLMQKEYSGPGGTAHAPHYSSQLKNLSRNRLLELADYLMHLNN